MADEEPEPTESADEQAPAPGERPQSTVADIVRILDNIAEKNPQIFINKNSTLFDVVKATSPGTFRPAETIHVPPVRVLRPEVSLLGDLRKAQAQGVDVQRAILTIQQAELDRANQRDAADATRQKFDNRMSWAILVFTFVAAVTGVIAVLR